MVNVQSGTSKEKALRLTFTLATAASFGWLSFFVGVIVTERRVGIENKPSAFLYEFEGKKVGRADLPEELRRALDAAQSRSEESKFLADYNYYREQERVARSQIVASHIEAEAARTKKSVEDIEKELLGQAEVSESQARNLFFASDPAASRKDFEKLSPQLKAYIAEIARHEALEKVVKKLETTGHAKTLVRRPVPKKVTLDVVGFPSTGNKKSVHTVVSFVDYFCEGCEHYNVAFSEVVRDFQSHVNFVFMPFPFTRPDRSISLARGAICADSLGKFLDYHMAVLAKGGTAENSTALEIAVAAGIDARGFNQCYLQNQGVGELLRAAEKQAARAGVLRPPVAFFGGKLFEDKNGLEDLREELTSLGSQAKLDEKAK